MSLYSAESKRLVKRRFTRFMLLGVFVVLGLIAGGVFFTTEHIGPAQMAEAQATTERYYQEGVQEAAAGKQSCEADPKGQDCEAIFAPPSRDDYDVENNLPSTFDFKSDHKALSLVLVAMLAMAGFIIGASFVGAEWNSGGMMTLLLWRPQRMRVLGAKLAALLVATGGITVLASAVWAGILLLTATLHGTTEGMTAGGWRSYALLGLRGVGLVVAATALGFALAMLGRHTAMALGVAGGVLVVFQVGLGVVLAAAQVPYANLYLIPTWLGAWLDKSVEVPDTFSCVTAVDECKPDIYLLTWPLAGGVIGGVVLLMVMAAMWTMRNRDIT